MTSRRRATSNQRCVRQGCNLQRRINVVYFNVALNNVRQHQNNVANMTMKK